MRTDFTVQYVSLLVHEWLVGNTTRNGPRFGAQLNLVGLSPTFRLTYTGTPAESGTSRNSTLFQNQRQPAVISFKQSEVGLGIQLETSRLFFLRRTEKDTKATTKQKQSERNRILA